MPPKSPHGISNRKLAAQLGISSHLVSRKRQQGKPDDVIAAEADVHRQKTAHRKTKPPTQRAASDRMKSRARKASIASVVPPNIDDIIAELPDTAETFFEAQRRKESALADLRQIEVRKESGELVEAEAVRVEWSKHISAVKNSLLLLPSKLAPKLSVASEVLQCQHILDSAIRSVLTELSEYKTSAAA